MCEGIAEAFVMSIFGTYRVAAGMGKNNRTRPMSASEATQKQDETLFNMRQRHWEGLIAGKKTLHHGKLLPGSSTSDEDGQPGKSSTIKPPPTCWSEVSSPRKQVQFLPSYTQ